jgi:hypothetical protein
MSNVIAGTTPVQDPPEQPRAREVYQQLNSEISSVPTSNLITINIDVPTAIATVLGVWPKVQNLRPRVAALPEFDLQRFDGLENYALATAHAQTLHQAASSPPPPIEQLVESGVALRDVLLADASALSRRQLIDGQRLKELKGSTGYLDLAFDLSILAAVMRGGWSEISDKTAVTLAELDRAEVLGERLLVAIGKRSQSPVDAAATSLNRQRAFTLMVNAYDQVRRAVTYLEWDVGDQDILAPSLYAGRAARRKGAPSAEQPAPTAATPAPGVTAPAATPAPSAPEVPVGMPGSNPYAQ